LFCYKSNSSTDDVDELEPATPVSNVPRSLNSDISYFGVGGKQAIFFVGNSARVRFEIIALDLHCLTHCTQKQKKAFI